MSAFVYAYAKEIHRQKSRKGYLRWRRKWLKQRREAISIPSRLELAHKHGLTPDEVAWYTAR